MLLSLSDLEDVLFRELRGNFLDLGKHTCFFILYHAAKNDGLEFFDAVMLAEPSTHESLVLCYFFLRKEHPEKIMQFMDKYADFDKSDKFMRSTMNAIVYFLKEDNRLKFPL